MKVVVSTEKAPSAIGPYSQGVAAAGLLFVSGQLPVDPKTGEIVPGSIKEQTRQSLENLKEVLEAGRASLSAVVKTTVFLHNMDDFTEMNSIYAEVFGKDGYPVRSTVEVSRLPKNALVEIEATAVLNPDSTSD